MFKLNYPIETEEAQKFWASNHKCNRVKAIVAFSLNESNANDNLRRFGYPRAFRERVLDNFSQYINQPDMKGIPISDMKDFWWEEMPYNGG